jgi:D-alanyl-lipoteichoic acid acyltransferase DltB (MBOAT superfamily)
LGVLITRELERSQVYRERVPKLLKQFGVFLFVSFTWIFFRADSLGDAWLIIHRIFFSTWHDPQIPALMLLLMAVIWLYQFLYESKLRGLLAAGPVRVGLSAAMILYLCVCASGGGAFIYFQF